MTATTPLPTVTRLAGEIRIRTLGLGLVLAGASAAWFFVLCPLSLAEAGAARVSMQWKTFLFAPLAGVMGLVLLCAGGRAAPFLGRPPRGRREVTVVVGLFLLAVALGAAGLWWTEARLHALGYAAKGFP